MRHADALAALERQIDRARAALQAERAWPLALVPIAALALWLAAALAGVQTVLAPLAASLLAIAALAAIIAFILRATLKWRPPSRLEARARLERDARLDPGSLAALEDQPAKLDPFGLALWRRAQNAAADAALRARARPARTDWARIDRLKLRYAAPIALAIGLIVAGQNAPDRLAQALIPDAGPLLGDKPLQIEGWLAPAAYTGAAPIGLSDRIGQTVATPPSVEATLRVSGPVGAPVLRFRGKGGERTVKFARQADGAWEAKLTLPGPGRIEVVRFHTKARWWVRPAPDAAPSALFVEAPKIVKDRVQFSWEGKDDFGVRAAYLALTPVNPPPGLVDAPAERTPLDSPADEPRTAHAKADLDLRPHRYAGMEVDARIIVRDAMGQEGMSQPVRFKLPEQLFLQPLAQAAVEIRKNILYERRPYAPAPKRDPAKDAPAMVRFPDPLLGYVDVPIRTDDVSPRLERAPAGIHRAAQMIDALTIAPSDGYFNDAALFMGFKLARATLTGAHDLAGADEAADMLWQCALRAEYGDSASAKKAMEMAQKAMSEALQRGASPEEIERLSQALQDATNRYMQALVQEAIREGRYAETEEDSQARQQAMNQQTIDEMMREIERLAKEGKTEEANQLLQQLSQMMQNMQVQLARGQSGEGGPQDQNKMTQEMEDLSSAMGEQRALRDETQGAQNGEQQQGRDQQQQQQQSGDQLANRQERLQRQMEGVSKGLKDKGGEGEKGAGGREAGEQLDRAGRAMREAENALRRNEFGEAQRAQEDALRQMRAAAEALSRDQMGQQEQAQGENENGPQQRDPLGRRIGGLGAEGDEVTVPESVQRERAREILDELRRRAQDPRRPEGEREYLRRLLDRFSGGS
jgi:hypothetical protein